MISANDLCARCGRGGHFIKTCYAKFDVNGEKIESSESGDTDNESDDYTCYRCGREGHYANKCYAKSDISGNKL